MKEIKGNLWDFVDTPRHTICVTTNGDVKKTGEAVMGKGVAKQAAVRYPELPKILGQYIASEGEQGNRVWHAPTSGQADHFLLIFPTKHHWRESSDLNLIKHSATQLAFHAHRNPLVTYVLPRPGCGAGELKWEEVKAVIAPILPDNVVVINL